jgi:hypothetical protein
MSPLRLTEAALVVLPALAGGCFTTRAVSLHDLESLGDLHPARIITRDGAERRAVIGPGSLGPATLRITPLRYGPGSWVVRFGGWPLVYTSGRVLRNEIAGDVWEIPVDEVKEVRFEKYSWSLTFLTLPLTLPPGIIDLVVHHARFGFDTVDTRYDTFSRPPGTVKDPALPPP